jgi:hypothetical protein
MRSEYGSSVSSARHKSICAMRSDSAIACFGADSSASASRLIGLTSAARLMLTWMRSASASIAGLNHSGLSSSRPDRVLPVRLDFGQQIGQQDRFGEVHRDLAVSGCAGC